MNGLARFESSSRLPKRSDLAVLLGVRTAVASDAFCGEAKDARVSILQGAVNVCRGCAGRCKRGKSIFGGYEREIASCAQSLLNQLGKSFNTSYISVGEARSRARVCGRRGSARTATAKLGVLLCLAIMPGK